MLSYTSMQPSAINTLVDAFFELKKSEVKNRLRSSLDSVVDELFVQLVSQVKQLIVPETVSSKNFTPHVNVAVSSNEAIENDKTSATTQPLASQYFAIKSNPFNACSAKQESLKRSINDSFGSQANSGTQNIPKQFNEVDNNGNESQIKLQKRLRLENEKNFDANCQINNPPRPRSGGDKQCNNSPNKFVCNHGDCRKSFSSRSHFNRHIRFHQKLQPYSCKWPYCSYASADKSNTLRHIRSAHFKKANFDTQPSDPNVYLEIKQELIDQNFIYEEMTKFQVDQDNNNNLPT